MAVFAKGSRVCVDVPSNRQLLEVLHLYDEGERSCHVGIKMNGSVVSSTKLGVLVRVDAVGKSFVFANRECCAIDVVPPPVYHVVLHGKICRIAGVIFPREEEVPMDFHKSRDLAVQQVKCIADPLCESMEVEGGTIGTRFLWGIHGSTIPVSILQIAEEEAVKKAPVVKGDPVVKEGLAGLWQVLRMAQRKTGCPNKTMKVFANAVQKWARSNGMIDSDSSGEEFEGEEADFILKKQANAVVLQLHGCVGCNAHVFLPRDRSLRCPKCSHPRFNSKRKSNEVQTLFARYYP